MIGYVNKVDTFSFLRATLQRRCTLCTTSKLIIILFWQPDSQAYSSSQQISLTDSQPARVGLQVLHMRAKIVLLKRPKHAQIFVHSFWSWQGADRTRTYHPLSITQNITSERHVIYAKWLLMNALGELSQSSSKWPLNPSTNHQPIRRLLRCHSFTPYHRR